MREYREIQMNRLIARLGLTPYVVKAPLSDLEVVPREYKIMFSQHIGAPAKPVVKKAIRSSAVT